VHCRNLVTAATAAGVRRRAAQSIASAYTPRPEPRLEEDPLDTAAEGSCGISIGGVVALERQTLRSPPLAGVMLRYGQLYGFGTGSDAPAGPAPLQIDAAAYAALLALGRGAPGILNIAEPNAYAATEKARKELGWNPEFRRPG
jgi:hypothetical protein